MQNSSEEKILSSFNEAKKIRQLKKILLNLYKKNRKLEIELKKHQDQTSVKPNIKTAQCLASEKSGKKHSILQLRSQILAARYRQAQLLNDLIVFSMPKRVNHFRLSIEPITSSRSFILTREKEE